MREIAEILKELRPKKGSQLSVAKLLDITSQQLGSYERGDYKPKADFFDKWKEVFGEDLREIQKGNVQRNVSHGTEKPTPAMKSTDNKDLDIRGHVYTDLIEKNSDYKLLPTMLLTDYSMIPKRILEGHEKEIARQEKLIEKYEGLIHRLEKEIETLRSRPVPASKNA